MVRILVTGGAGFIGSHVVEKLADTYPDADITVLDKMTYAADIENIPLPLRQGRVRLDVGDICDFDTCRTLMDGVDWVIHTAAESHVDNSFGNSLLFSQTNTLGTHTLLEAARQTGVALFLHLSTDEVYGEIAHGAFDEGSALNPSNPYSASKASADMIVNSYRHSFGTPVITARANNIFGKRQFPEKIIPKFAVRHLFGQKMTLHGTGENTRCYLAAEDFADALMVLLEKGKPGGIYNIGTDDEHSNAAVTRMICDALGTDFDAAVEFIADRPFNDCRYFVDSTKISALGWAPKRRLKDALPGVVAWYRENLGRYDDVFAGRP